MEGYHVENFGCRASRADGEAIALELRCRGLSPAPSAERASVIVVNTCTVTAQADRTARAFLRRLRRENPAARILVTGCYAQRAPGEVAALPGVAAVIGNSHKALVPQLAASAAGLAGFVPAEALRATTDPAPKSLLSEFRTAQAGEGPTIYADHGFAHSELAMSAAGTGSGQTRPNLKVQDGCGNRCSFCVIPATRGHSRSMPLATCLRAIEEFSASGGQELVLSGINLGRWGRDLSPALSLEHLVRAILEETLLPRLRLSSIEPMDWTAELLNLFTNEAGISGPRLARHAHLPLQSGSDSILRAMHRRYRPWHYAAKLAAIRERLPDAAIGADVMVGFPGETEALFEESFAFIAAQSFTYLHLFPFSARPETPAWQLQQLRPVPPEAVTARMVRLRRLIDQKNLAFRQSFLGRGLPVVTLETPEHEARQGHTRAMSDNFLKVRLRGNFSANQSLQSSITAMDGEGLAGSVAASGVIPSSAILPDAEDNHGSLHLTALRSG